MNWLHGHDGGNAGVAYYDKWVTAQQGNVSLKTDWVVMCGTNAGPSQLKLANGVSVGTANGGAGGVELIINDINNARTYGNSDFAIAEVVVWPRGLTPNEMRRASKHLMDSMGMPS